MRDLAYDARAVAPGALFFCVPGTRVDGHDFAAAGGRERRGGARRRAAARARVPQIVVADARAAMAPAADVFFGEPTHELEVAGVTGTSGKTTTSFLLFAILAAAGRQTGPARDDRGARRRRAARRRADDARGDRPAADVPRDARRRRPHVRDGGVVARVRPPPARLRPLPRSRLHEPQPGSPRLPRRHGDVLPGEAAALPRGATAGRGHQRRGRVRAAARGGAARRDHVRRGRRVGARGHRSQAPRPLQRRERARRRARGARARL